MGRINRPPRFRPQSGVRVSQPRGRSGLTIDRRAAEKEAQRLTDAAADSIVEMVGRAAYEIAQQAYRDWPRATGRSAEAISLTWRIEGQRLIGTIDCDVPYIDDPPLVRAGDDLLAKPAEQAERDIADRVEKSLERKARSG